MLAGDFSFGGRDLKAWRPPSDPGTIQPTGPVNNLTYNAGGANIFRATTPRSTTGSLKTTRSLAAIPSCDTAVKSGPCGS